MTIGFDFRMGGSMNAGIGRYAFELLQHILDADRGNTYVIFYHPANSLPGDLEKFKKYANATLVRAPFRHYSWQEQIKFLRVLLHHKLDLAHFPNFNVPVFYRRPYVVTIHDVVHHKISGHKKSRLYSYYAYKAVINAAARNSKKIITVSQWSKKEIMHYLSAPGDKIEVIPEAPTLKPVSPEISKNVKGLYLLSRPYFLFVGTLERKKNVIGLVKGFDKFVEEHKLDMDLVVAGKIDPHYPEIKFQALDSLKHGNRVVFTGYVTDQELSALYQEAYAYVSASIHEGFGLPGVEAMRFGLPLIVSNTEVFNETYDDAAIYFDPNNPHDLAEKLGLLAKDKQFYKQQQQKSLARAQQFSWEEAAQLTLDVYRNVLQ